MAAGDGNTGLYGLLRAAAQYLTDHVVGQIAGERCDVQGEERPPAHGVDVAQRIGCGNRSVGVRVVDDGREEIDRRDQRLVVAQPVDGSIVRVTETDQQVGIVSLVEQVG